MQLFIIIVIAACLIWGWMRGIIVQLGSLLSFAIAIAACQILGDSFTDAVTAIMGTPAADNAAGSAMARFMASSVAHILLFLLIWLAVWLIARAMKIVVRAAHLGILDRIAGSIFMAFKAALIISFVINFAQWAFPSSLLATSDSALIRGLGDVAPWLLGYIEPLL